MTIKSALITAGIAILAVGAASGVVASNYSSNSSEAVTSHPVASQTASTPDWTYAPCSDWADTEFPVLPKYTRTDACVADDGSLVYAPKN